MKFATYFVVFLFTAVTGSAENAYNWFDSNHKANSKFTISSAAQLAELAHIVNGTSTRFGKHDFKGDTIVLGNGIDLAGWLSENTDQHRGWMPIGLGRDAKKTDIFNGTFDGQGHTISGLWINRSIEDNIGLFGYIGCFSMIHDLMVTVDTDQGGVNGFQAVGGLTGNNMGKIVRCAAIPVWASSEQAMVTGVLGAGGLVGYNICGSLFDSYASGVVMGVNSLGGLVGGNEYECTLFNCYATGAIIGRRIGELAPTAQMDEGYIGGLAGYNAGRFGCCYAEGVVTGTQTGIYIGSLIGEDVHDVSGNLFPPDGKIYATLDIPDISPLSILFEPKPAAKFEWAITLPETVPQSTQIPIIGDPGKIAPAINQLWGNVRNSTVKYYGQFRGFLKL